MLYSSGTTGRPKGIQRPLTFPPMGQGLPGAVPFLRALGLEDGGVYLCPAPLYHAAPLAWSTAAHRLGATVVVMERFDPAQALALIERHRVTHAQFVPTMFVRMLKLPDAERLRYDHSSLRAVVHAAAPCPVEVKRQMIDWWGPIVSEFYSATEGLGATFITAQEWLAHPGSVGRPMLGIVHVLDDDGDEVAAGEIGTIWFEGGLPFEYHNDPDKTASTMNEKGWATVGDVGYVDDDGYLYLTDRKTFMIISGGVNIYPQEVENLLVTHPKVMDVAVIGVPNDDLGEEVKAVVQPVDVGRRRPGARAGAGRATAGRTWPPTSARAASTSSPSCPGSTRASSTSACSEIATGRRPAREPRRTAGRDVRGCSARSGDRRRSTPSWSRGRCTSSAPSSPAPRCWP